MDSETITKYKRIIIHVRERCERNCRGHFDLNHEFDVNELPSLGFPCAGDRFWQACGDLLYRPWLDRLWVIQEVVLAHRVEIRCGTQDIDLELLSAFVEYLFNHRIQNVARANKIQRVHERDGFVTLADFIRLRQQRKDWEKENDYYQKFWVLLLERVRIKGVQKPIDRVYGILCILREDIGTAVTVDYYDEKDFWRPYI